MHAPVFPETLITGHCTQSITLRLGQGGGGDDAAGDDDGPLCYCSYDNDIGICHDIKNGESDITNNIKNR